MFGNLPMRSLVLDWQLEIRHSGAIIIERLTIADRFWSRLCGLQFRRPLPQGEGILLVPCASIHTMWMRFAIDVAMLDRTGKVMSLHRAVRPWRIVSAPRGTHAVLETSAGNLPLSPGDILALRSPSGQALPVALSRFEVRGK